MEKEANKPWYLNCCLLSIAGAVAMVAAVFVGYSVQTGLFFMLEAYLSIFYVEAINYVEHYGLQRKKLDNGEY